jgi:hypothetical protein
MINHPVCAIPSLMILSELLQRLHPVVWHTERNAQNEIEEVSKSDDMGRLIF